MSSQLGSRRGRALTWLALLVVLAAAAGVGVWWWLTREAVKPPPDMVAVLRLNNKGIGHMEQFEYKDAIPTFEKVVEMAPDWLPGQINLGIALFNWSGQTDAEKGGQKPGDTNLDRASGIFEQILKKDPKDPYANHCLGIIWKYRSQLEKAAPYFKAVTEIDPQDPFGWFYLGLTRDPTSEESLKYFEKACQLDPYLDGAVYGLAMGLRFHDATRAKQVLAEYEALRKAGWSEPCREQYGEMGRYADVIGKPERQPARGPSAPLPLFEKAEAFKVQLADGARWATSADLGPGPAADLRRAVRQRWGATLVLLDYDKDGKIDLLLLGAVLENGEVRDLLLRQEEPGTFRDVTVAAGLGGARPTLGCTVADFDNDGYPDLVLTGAGRIWLFRNVPGPKGGRRFEDVTAAAGLDKLDGVCLGATFVDLDNDGDLDLVLARYAATPEAALQALQGKATRPGPGLTVFLNVGEAPPAKDGELAPLQPRFRQLENVPGLLGGPVAAVNQTVTDLDGDQDVDLLVFADGGPPTAVLNDRLLRFHRSTFPETLLGPGEWNGALVLDANRDWRSDLFLVGPKQRPIFLRANARRSLDPKDWFKAGQTNSPPLLQAHAVDLDLDGRTDVVGLSSERQPVFLHNEDGKLVVAPEALGNDAGWPKDLVAVAVGDFDGDSLPDLLTWSEGTGLQLHRNRGNGNHSLPLTLTGLHSKGNAQRCNADGAGCRVVAQAGDVVAGQELGTLSAGLGQSSQPLLLGLGRHAEAEVVRLRWPDGIMQAELSKPAGQLTQIREDNRKTNSCPILFTWDGQRFAFVTDFLGAGSIGEPLPEGGHRQPRAEEAVKIEANQLVPQGGRYLLKLAEPMDEVTYLDRLQLLVIDHPETVRVYPDERFATGTQTPSQDLLAFDSRQEIYPVKALDHKGRDVTQTLRHLDRDTVDGFAHRSWLGFAEEHYVSLDFGERLAKFGPKDRLLLCLAGWTDYPYPESIWAATQAGVPLQPPVLERLGEDGHWHTVLADPGFPAGLPRMMTVDVTGKLGGPRCVLRLRTNMQVYWDQIFIAPLLERAAPTKHSSDVFHVVPLEVQQAKLEARGCMQEHSPDGKLPRLYDYDQLVSVPVARLAGRLTRFGDVKELLRDVDDRFVIFGPGDEVSVAFDATGLKPLPVGWTRSFVLRTWGYCKDCSPFTATGSTVEPLPFRAMTSFPYGPGERHPHEHYRRTFNTRQVGRE